VKMNCLMILGARLLKKSRKYISYKSLSRFFSVFILFYLSLFHSSILHYIWIRLLTLFFVLEDLLLLNLFYYWSLSFVILVISNFIANLLHYNEEGVWLKCWVNLLIDNFLEKSKFALKSHTSSYFNINKFNRHLMQ